MSESLKAQKYLKDLEEARCAGQWAAVPELVRKVRKHANDRACLTLTAEVEHAIVSASEKQPATEESKSTEVAKYIPKLLDAIDAENAYLEDKYQARVCVGWAHWTIGEYAVAATRLPGNIEQEYAQFDDLNALSEWTKVCVLKAAYLKANCLSRKSERVNALTALQAALDPLGSVWQSGLGRQQVKFWAELFLTEFCMLQAQAIEQGEKTLEDDNALAPFRTWAQWWDASKTRGTPLQGGHGFRGAVPRRRVWNEYYSALSGILMNDLPFPLGHLASVPTGLSAKSQLRTELKKVETIYEGLLLKETSFPRADQEREEVEAFVGTVMDNWNILIGREWPEYELGSGGKDALSRGVLDILYRAATKTFHSTAILRHLFVVHLSVAEFDLAMSAFNSYLEIVKKGKARVDKTGHPEPSLDDDGTVLETISLAITALCRYGSRDAAETAQKLAVELEEMIHSLPSPLPATEKNITTLDEENGNGVVLHPRITSQVHAIAWQAVGLSQAQWSRSTYDATLRTEIQSKAIQSLQKSLSPETGNPTDVRTLFTLGLLLAEKRELTAAIDVVKAALMSHKKSVDHSLSNGHFWRERSLIPLWHLLALLLSARQDYLMAARACEGAFEQFDDPTVLFGSQSLQGPFRSDHLNEAEGNNEKAQPRGLVDEMDDLEKDGIVEVKMTQLALLELLEGPEIAVNASHELLVLYTRLFGTLQPNAPPPTQKLNVPKSSAGTIKSLRGSIFGNRSSRLSQNLKQSSTLGSEKTASITERPQTAQTTATSTTAAPTIQITRENGEGRSLSQTRKSSSLRGRRSESAHRGSLKKRDSSKRRAVSSGGAPHQPTHVDGEDFFTPVGEAGDADHLDFFSLKSKSGSASGNNSFHRPRRRSRADSISSSVKVSAPGGETFILDSLSAPNPLPPIQFPEAHVKRQRMATLIKVWLMIAGFYRRANMFPDSKGATEEARKLVDGLELEILKEASGSPTSRKTEWGAKKTTEELWSDVRAEMAYLLLAEGSPSLARGGFEDALMHYPDHPSAIVGLSNILLDIYSEELKPPSSVPGIHPAGSNPSKVAGFTSTNLNALTEQKQVTPPAPGLPSTPLGLVESPVSKTPGSSSAVVSEPSKPATASDLPAPYKAVSLPLVDRLAARDRAYGLLSTLTKLGSGWNYSEAWFALARAHEESGQPEKAKEALWWCVELEEGKGVREWTCVGNHGYVL